MCIGTHLLEYDAVVWVLQEHNITQPVTVHVQTVRMSSAGTERKDSHRDELGDSLNAEKYRLEWQTGLHRLGSV
jgi:hypothetical protein